jgi:hypothetical protein
VEMEKPSAHPSARAGSSGSAKSVSTGTGLNHQSWWCQARHCATGCIEINWMHRGQIGCQKRLRWYLLRAVNRSFETTLLQWISEWTYVYSLNCSPHLTVVFRNQKIG